MSDLPWSGPLADPVGDIRRMLERIHAAGPRWAPAAVPVAAPVRPWPGDGPVPGEVVLRHEYMQNAVWLSPHFWDRPETWEAAEARAVAGVYQLVHRRGGSVAGRVSVQRMPAPRAEAGDDFRLFADRVHVVLPARMPHVVGADQPALRIVHEGLRDVLDWLGWPSIQGSEEVLARG